MTEWTCAQVEEAVTEYALGILPLSESQAVRTHLSSCEACQGEAQEARIMGDRLLDLIPDAEPPLGFDHKVLVSFTTAPGRWRTRRVRVVLSGVAAALVAVAVLVTTSLGGHSGPRTDRTAALRQDERTVGSIYIGGHPTWVTMTVDHLALTGRVTCQLVLRDGSTATVGDFQLVDGSGTWSAPDPAVSTATGARLIGPDGSVLATATF